MGIKSTFLGAAVAAVALTGAASAAQLSFSGTGFTATLPGGAGNTSDFNLGSSTGLVAGTDQVTVFNSTNVGGLQTSLPGVIKVEYLGSEAGNENAAFELTSGLTALFNNKTSVIGDMATFIDDGGLIDFLFRDISDGQDIKNADTSVAPVGLSIAFSSISANGRSVIALFGDGEGDSDYDDIAIRISTVPVPAAGLLLLTAVGGLGFAKRRKQKS